MQYTHKLDLKNPFHQALNNRFKSSDALNIVKILHKLDIPIPEKQDEFLSGNDGLILFMDNYNVTVRIEDKEAFFGSRIEHPHILQPIFSAASEKSIVEILPSSTLEDIDDRLVADVKARLYEDGLYFWDDHGGNVGRLPFSTPEFPDGVPIVIDRLAVERVDVSHLLDHLKDFGTPEDLERLETNKPEVNDYAGKGEQEKFYAPLRDAFQKTFDNPENSAESIQKAWKICTEFKAEGKLIAGWHGTDKHIDTPSFIEDIAKKYAKRMPRPPKVSP